MGWKERLEAQIEEDEDALCIAILGMSEFALENSTLEQSFNTIGLRLQLRQAPSQATGKPPSFSIIPMF